MSNKKKLELPSNNIDLTNLNSAFPDLDLPGWQRWFDAGYEWRSLSLYLENLMTEEPGAILYHGIKIFALAMSLELYVKAWASYSDDNFDPMKYKHKTMDIINKHKTLGIFSNIVLDEELCSDIIMLQNVVNTKYGDTVVYERDLEKLKTLLGDLQELITQTTNRGYSSRQIAK